MGKKIKLLIVEDEFLLTLELKTTLELMGYEVFEPVASGQEALRKVAEERPDIVIIDINLVGDMTGLELARRLNETVKLPLIFITGIADERTLDRMRELMPLASFIKPLHAQDIHKVIRRIPEFQ
jgi:DNA-binding response OmpR family regulator